MPISVLLNRAAILIFIIEMTKMKYRILSSQPKDYMMKAVNINRVRAFLLFFLLVENLILFYINMELDFKNFGMKIPAKLKYWDEFLKYPLIAASAIEIICLIVINFLTINNIEFFYKKNHNVSLAKA
jgi:hypothetical protein